MGESESGRCAYNNIVAEPLTKENHDEWFEWVRNYLVAQDLWDVVDGSSARPPEEDEGHKEEHVRWRRKNAAALHVIHISCSLCTFSLIRGVSEAKDAWHILNDTFDLPEPESKPESEPQGEQDFSAGVLYNAICDNNWCAVKALLDEHPSAFTTRLTFDGQTALHVAAYLGYVGMVEELVRIIPPEYLEIVDDNGFTPLLIAAMYSEVTGVAQCMVDKNNNILGIPWKDSSLPVTVAFSYGRKEIGRYLYSVTQLEHLKQGNGHLGWHLLYWCFISRDLDVALDLLQRWEELFFVADEEGTSIIKHIAIMFSVFSRESPFVFWKRWIYNYISIKSNTTDFVRVSIQQEGKRDRVQGGLLRRLITKTYNLLGMKEIYEQKLLHVRATQILSLLCKNVALLDRNMTQEALDISDAVNWAARKGNVEFVVQLLKAYPPLITLRSSTWGNTFFYAVEDRQAQVFNLIHGLRYKNNIASCIDDFGNTLLHVVGKLAPSYQLNRISGPALQMQRELQWFKEVESVVPLGYRLHPNNDGMKPDDIFKESHKELRKEGEKWMKETASSCSVVGALVVTIMFAVAFTVPGGNNQDFGYPIFLNEKLFVLFVISDALSLFSSSTSVLIFLGILTSRYAEEDFLKSLPQKLIIGLSTLFISIATMMIAYSAAIFIMFQHMYSWALIPIIMLASVPITIFVLLQFRLLVQMVSSTYGPGIFKKNLKPWP